jgi:two-component system response regulator
LEYLYTTDSEGIKVNIPSLILLDIKLPKVDGLEVLKHIRNIEITKYIPIVMLTSSTEERDLITAYELGANSYIKKPIDFNSFVEVINCMGLYWLLFNELPGSFFKKSA